MASAAECKQKGNECYHAKDYAGAAEWYSKAIEADPRSAVFYNNRAAAYLELRRFEDAARDAERSAVLAPTAKANARHGRALWHLNRTSEAIAAYERAQRLDPQNPEYGENLRTLRAGGAASGRASSGATGGASAGTAAAQPTRASFLLDMAVVLSAVGYVVTMFVSMGLAQRAWQLGIAAMLARQCLVVYATTPNAAVEMRTFGFWKDFAMTKSTTTFAGQYMVLTLALLLTGAPAQQFIFVAVALYALIDLVTNQRATMEQALRGSPVEAMLAPRMDQVRHNAQQLFLQAAACEAMAVFLLPLAGAPLVAALVIMQFVKWRFRHDQWSQHAWRGLHMQFRQYAHHPRCPAVVGTIFDKFAALLHRAGSA